MRRYDGLLGLRVLFVDDDLSTREAVLEVLELSRTPNLQPPPSA
jgi:hypothetical protein